MLVRWLFKILDLLKIPSIFQLFWHLGTRVSRLNGTETNAGGLVLDSDSIQYPSVRVAEGRILRLIFKLNRRRAFTLFHTINLPATGSHSRGNLDLLVHEMVHVYQFELVGSIYIWQALRAQKREGYRYGGWEQLAEDQESGNRLSDYNREQQGQIAQDYYNNVMEADLPAESPVLQAYQPFIADLQAGVL